MKHLCLRLQKKLLQALLCVSLLFCVHAMAASFTVQRIDVQGAQRIPNSTVLSYIALKPGQVFNTANASAVLKQLYNTGFFSDVQLERRGRVLLVKVKERPTISVVRVIGNHALPKKQLNAALQGIGLVAGKVLDVSKLKSIVEGLRQQYFDLGHYNAQVSPSVMHQSRNRVAIKVQVTEGPVAKIEGIQIIGNHHFSSSELLREFKLSKPTILSSLTHNDEYSRMKLDADIESLTSYYLDRGYLRFSVVSQQVSIAADGAGIYIVIGINEGPLYHFSGFNILKNPLGKKTAIMKLITFKAGDKFSRQQVLASNDAITRFLGDRGYAFPQVTPQPVVDDVKHLAFINYSVVPGQQVYIRRIDFIGNSATQEQVYRKRLQQFESSLYSLSHIEESKRLIANLQYVGHVDSQMTRVPGTNNQADLHFKIKPANAGKASVQVGYSDAQGFIYGANLSEPNFLGTGNFVALAFQRSAFSSNYSFTYANPFATTWGMSRNYSVYYSKTSPSTSLNYAPFDLDSYGFSIGAGVPLTSRTNFSASTSLERDHLDLASDTDPSYEAFAARNGHDFTQVGLSFGLTRSNYNAYPLPSSGTYHSIDVGFSLPATQHSLAYYTVGYTGQAYIPIYKSFIARMKAQVNYGAGLSGAQDFPFFKNYYIGGITTVPGYDSNSLGPTDKYGYALGGNLMMLAQTAVIFPNGISKNLRTELAFSAGNVFDTIHGQVNMANIRYSVGVNMTVLTPFLGAIQIGVALPLNVGSAKNNINAFGFSMGTSI